MGQQPSIPTDLSRELRVIGAGFSRTGTVSFALALEKLLQGPVCHGGTTILLREEAYIRKWIKVQSPDTSLKDIKFSLKELTAGYLATADTPFNQFVGELAEIYPNAIVICSTRDKESWYRSAQELFKYTCIWWLDIVFFPMPTLRYFVQWGNSAASRLERIYGISRVEMDCPELLTMHEDYVRRVVPKERLHFFDVKDGWEPLCKILNCPVPDEPFPRANDASSMRLFFQTILKEALLRWIYIFAVIGMTLAVTWYFGKHM